MANLTGNSELFEQEIGVEEKSLNYIMQTHALCCRFKPEASLGFYIAMSGAAKVHTHTIFSNVRLLLILLLIY